MQITQLLRSQKSIFLAATVALVGSSVAGAQSTLRVAADGFASIQDAIDAALSGDTILIEPGVYRGLGNRQINLGRKELTICSESGPASVLIDAEGTTALPFRSLLIEGGQTSATVIDGLTFTGGATLQGAVADPFNGGAIRMLGTSPIIRNCVFEDNTASCWGGAVFSGHGGTPLIENCMFRNNISGDGGGGFFSWDGSSPTIRNSVFIGNNGHTSGGALVHFSSELMVIEGCTFTQNTSSWQSAFTAFNLDVRNTVVWGNITSVGSTQTSGAQFDTRVHNSNFEGGLPYATWDWGGNISVDPRFKNDGFHLGLFSPCINAGDSSFVTVGQLDIDGRPRIVGNRVDMGADEYRSRQRTRLFR